MSDEQIEVEDKGTVREADIANALASVFGSDCVVRSPKLKDSGGEKELCDILVLALPYVLVFQLKWMQISDADLSGEKGGVERERLIRRMKKAAKQFNEFNSQITHQAVLHLRKPWSGNRENFDLSIKSIKHIVPIVLIDFEDAQYTNPQRRYTDIPPVVEDAPKAIQKWGAVHAFLMKDFERIIGNVFSVGDLLLWLKEREELLVHDQVAVLGYNELTLYSIYQTNISLWNQMKTMTGVLLDDSDMMERLSEKWREQYRIRKDYFASKDALNFVEEMMLDGVKCSADSESDADCIESFLAIRGRLLCMPSVIRKNASRKIRENLTKLRGNEGSEEKPNLIGSILTLDEKSPNSRTAFYLVAMYYVGKDVGLLMHYLRARALSQIKERQMQSHFDEIVIIVVRPMPMSVIASSCDIDSTSFNDSLPFEELTATRYESSMSRFSADEWHACGAW